MLLPNVINGVPAHQLPGNHLIAQRIGDPSSEAPQHKRLPAVRYFNIDDLHRINDLVTSMSSGIRTLAEQGIEVKDLNQGLIDFPHLRRGRVVYLCWRLGEGDIAYWHELDAGFAGRQELLPPDEKLSPPFPA